MDPIITILARLQLFAHALDPTTLAGVAIVAVLVSLLALPSRAQRAVAHLPRPSTALPLIGDTLTVLTQHRHTLPTWLYHECLRLHGQPYVIDALTKPPMIVLSSVEAIEDVFKHYVDSFVKGDEFTAALGDLFGRGIFVTDGIPWHAQRKTASRLFAPHLLQDLMDAVMVTKTGRLCSILCQTAQQGETVDIKHLLELFATDVFTAIGFGVELDLMTYDQTEFFERFGRANATTLFRQQQPQLLWKLKRLCGVGSEKQHLDDVAWLDQFVYQIIHDSIARRQTTQTQAQPQVPTTPPNNIVSLYLDSQENYEVQEIRDMAMAMISAGRDTTAYGMTWFLIMMAQYPDVQHRIRTELRHKLPQLFTGELVAPNKELTTDLVYLEAAIKENLRLNTIIPLNTRESIEDVTLRDGTFLAAGSKVLIPTYGMARLPWVWGPDALEFKPERWIEETTGKLHMVSPFKFLTFSAGRRICPGKQFSILEMKIALAAVLSKVEITTERDPHGFVYEASLALGIQGPVFIRPTLVHS